MNIVHFCPTGNWAGSEVMSSGYANWQAREHNVYFVLQESKSFRKTILQTYFNKNVKLIIIPENVVDFFQKVDYICDNLDKKPDILHASVNEGMFLAYACQKKFPNAATVGHLHMRYFNIIFSRADAIIMVSEWQQKDLPPWKKKDAFLAHNFITPQFGELEDIKIKARMIKHNLKIQNKYIFGIISRLSWEKGVDLAIEAFKILNLQDACLMIVGKGDEMIHLYNLSIGYNIRFFGFQKNTNIFYNMFDCYLQPSRFESFGLCILEAMSYNIPVIASNCCGPKDILDKKFLFDADNIESLSKKMLEMYKNRPKVIYDFTRFSLENSVKSVDLAYKYALEKRKAFLNP